MNDTEFYLEDRDIYPAQKTVSHLVDYLICAALLSPDQTQYILEQSVHAKNIASGLPFSIGNPPAEIAERMMRELNLPLCDKKYDDHGYLDSSTHWAGFIAVDLLYRAHKNDFKDIFSIIPLREMLEDAPIHHEASEERYYQRKYVARIQEEGRSRRKLKSGEESNG